MLSPTQAVEGLDAGSGQESIFKDIRDTVLGITRKYDRAYWLQCAKEGRFTDESWQALCDAGLMGLSIPEQYGGMGESLTGLIMVQDLLSRAGTPNLLLVVTGLARVPLVKHGTPEQVERYVVPTITGKKRICFAITEPDAGTNTFRIKTHAKQTRDGWELNGQKVFISCAEDADYILVVARTRPAEEGEARKQGISLFMVDARAQGIEKQKLNINVAGPDRQYMVFFDNVKLDKDSLIGPEGEGLRCLFDGLNPERLLTAACSVGIGDYALAKTVQYVNGRAPFGQPLGAYQGVQHPMARAKARIDGARITMYEACRTFDAGGDAGRASNTAKLLASEAAVEACDAAIQFHGGYGFDADYDVITLWPFARLLKVAPVNNEIILNFIGQHVLGMPKSY
ncbi:MAG TPA: acyl-CoA dehydrogenase family protein [bacterium]